MPITNKNHHKCCINALSLDGILNITFCREGTHKTTFYRRIFRFLEKKS
jgi:hypothetical protein